MTAVTAGAQHKQQSVSNKPVVSSISALQQTAVDLAEPVFLWVQFDHY